NVACRSIQIFQFAPHMPIVFGQTSSSSHPAGAGALRASRPRQGPLNFTCASVTVRHFIRATAEDCRSAVAELAPKRWGTMPLLRNGQQLHALDHGGHLIGNL